MQRIRAEPKAGQFIGLDSHGRRRHEASRPSWSQGGARPSLRRRRGRAPGVRGRRGRRDRRPDRSRRGRSIVRRVHRAPRLRSRGRGPARPGRGKRPRPPSLVQSTPDASLGQDSEVSRLEAGPARRAGALASPCPPRSAQRGPPFRPRRGAPSPPPRLPVSRDLGGIPACDEFRSARPSCRSSVTTPCPVTRRPDAEDHPPPVVRY